MLCIINYIKDVNVKFKNVHNMGRHYKKTLCRVETSGYKYKEMILKIITLQMRKDLRG